MKRDCVNRTGLVEAQVCPGFRAVSLLDSGRWLSVAVVGHDAVVGLAGDEASEAADDVFLGEAFGAAAADIVDGGLVGAHADDHDPVDRGVGLAVRAAVEAVEVDLPGRCGDGAGAAEFR